MEDIKTWISSVGSDLDKGKKDILINWVNKITGMFYGLSLASESFTLADVLQTFNTDIKKNEVKFTDDIFTHGVLGYKSKWGEKLSDIENPQLRMRARMMTYSVHVLIRNKCPSVSDIRTSILPKLNSVFSKNDAEPISNGRLRNLRNSFRQKPKNRLSRIMAEKSVISDIFLIIHILIDCKKNADLDFTEHLKLINSVDKTEDKKYTKIAGMLYGCHCGALNMEFETNSEINDAVKSSII